MIYSRPMYGRETRITPQPPFRHLRDTIYGDLQVSKSKVIETKRRENGFRPMTNHSAAVARDGFYYPVNGTCEYTAGRYFYEIRDPMPVYLPSLVPDLKLFEDYTPSNSQINQLKIMALNKVKDQKINVLMTLQGAKSTLDTIYNSLVDLNNFVRDVKSGRLVKALRRARKYFRSQTQSVINKFRRSNQKAGKPLARMWLEVNFVHMQIYSDVKGLYEEFQKEVGLPFVHGRAALVEHSGPVQVKTGNLGSGMGSCAVGGTLNVKRLHYCQLSYSVESDALKRASSIGLVNVPYLLWDMTPLSFIVDWILPMGAYFNSMDATLGLSFEGGMVGSIRSCDGVLHQVDAPGPSPSHPPERPLTGSFTCPVNYKAYNRVVLEDDKVHPPGFRNPLSGISWKIATLSAIIAGRIDNPKPRK